MRNGYICVPSCGIRFPFKNEVSSFCFLYSDEIDPHLEKGQAGLSGDFRDAAIRVEADLKLGKYCLKAIQEERRVPSATKVQDRYCRWKGDLTQPL